MAVCHVFICGEKNKTKDLDCVFITQKKQRKNKEVFAAMCNKIQGIHEDHFKIKSNMCCV